MEQYLERDSILNALRANLEGADRVEAWYKYRYGYRDGPVQIVLNIWLAN